jgi:hypothetical protein
MIPDLTAITSDAVITAAQCWTAWKLADVKEDTMLGKLIGPSMEYVGERIPIVIDTSIKEIPKTAMNILRILGHAVRISGSKCDEHRIVNPRVLRQIFDEGAFCEDELTSVYFGGVLASSRNEDFKDDRALNFLSLLSSMSSYQIKLHYMIYTVLRKAYVGKDINFESDWKSKMQLFITLNELLTYVDQSPIGNCKHDLIMPHLFWGLDRFDLISNFTYGNELEVLRHCHDGQGAVFQPSIFGIEFYMWANGLSDVSPSHFIDENIQLLI